MKNVHILQENIFITSDEEIKKGDWYVNTLDKRIRKNNIINHSYHKKIILTTDQDLIKDGVQAIDDDFIEWSVKNPSCEEVEVRFFCCGGYDDKCESKCFRKSYEIIIPKEEPKQETLEEVAEKYDEKYIEYVYDAFIDGAKWQQERMYSEEEVYHILCEHTAELFKGSKMTLTEWFEQYKKK